MQNERENTMLFYYHPHTSEKISTRREDIRHAGGGFLCNATMRTMHIGYVHKKQVRVQMWHHGRSNTYGARLEWILSVVHTSPSPTVDCWLRVDSTGCLPTLGQCWFYISPRRFHNRTSVVPQTRFLLLLLLLLIVYFYLKAGIESYFISGSS